MNLTCTRTCLAFFSADVKRPRSLYDEDSLDGDRPYDNEGINVFKGTVQTVPSFFSSVNFSSFGNINELTMPFNASDIYINTFLQITVTVTICVNFAYLYLDLINKLRSLDIISNIAPSTMFSQWIFRFVNSYFYYHFDVLCIYSIFIFSDMRLAYSFDYLVPTHIHTYRYRPILLYTYKLLLQLTINY